MINEKKKKKKKLTGPVLFVINEKKKKKKPKLRGLVVFVIKEKKKKKERAGRLCDKSKKNKKQKTN